MSIPEDGQGDNPGVPADLSALIDTIRQQERRIAALEREKIDQLLAAQEERALLRDRVAELERLHHRCRDWWERREERSCIVLRECISFMRSAVAENEEVGEAAENNRQLAESLAERVEAMQAQRRGSDPENDASAERMIAWRAEMPPVTWEECGNREDCDASAARSRVARYQRRQARAQVRK